MALNYHGIDRDKAIRRARNHSRSVLFLKFFMPLCAVATMGLYFIPSKVSVDLGEKRVLKIDVSETGRMINPRFSGVDKTNGKYSVEAAYGVPDFQQPHLIKLHKIAANAENKGQGWIRVDATAGLFNRQKERLDLTQGIQIRTKTGLAADLKSAQVFIKNQLIQSKQPVHVRMPNGTVHAGGLTFNTASSELQFKNNVQVQLVNNQPVKSRSTSAGGLGAMFQNNREPIDVASRTLTINNKTRSAEFLGEVSARQSDLSLQARSLKIDYNGQENNGTRNAGGQPQAPSGQTIRQIIALDNVLITTGNGQQASAQMTVFDNHKRLITLQNNVVVKQGANSLKGQKLVVDINKRHSYFPNGAGRVVGVFTPPRNGKAKKSVESVSAQDTSQQATLVQSFSNFSQQSDDPLHVAANRLDIFDLKRTAIFKGNVEVNRGQNSIRSGYLKLDYVGDAPIAGAQGKRRSGTGTQIRRLIAKNSVLITTPNNQSLTSDQAVFNVASNTIVIEGNVVLTQSNNVLKGNKLVINLTTGEYSFATSRDSKVRGVFTPRNFNAPEGLRNR